MAKGTREKPSESSPLLSGSSSGDKEPSSKPKSDLREDNDPSSDVESGSKDNVGLRRILSLAKEERSVLILASVALAISALASLALPQFAGHLVDRVTKFKDTEEGRSLAKQDVYNQLLTIVVIILVGAVASTLRSYLFTAASEKVVARLRKQLFTKLITQEIAFFDVTRTGDLLNRLSEDTQIIKNAATINLSEALRSAATGTLALAYMFFTSWRLTLLTLVVLPPVSVGIRYFGLYLRKLSEKTQTASAAAASVAEECLGSVRTVRVFAQEGAESNRYGEKVDVSMNLGIQQAFAIGLFSGGVFGSASLCIIAVVVYGAILTINGQMTVGNLSAFILYSVTVGFSFGTLSGLYATTMKAVGASRRVFQLLDRVSEMPPAGDKTPPLESNGPGVVLDNVWFAYPSRPEHWVLKGINLKLTPGSRVALVGPSGGGKSTIASLVKRLYDPQRGTISFGGVPIPEIDNKYLHSMMSIVNQEPTLFNQSIADNIAYGIREAATREEIEKVARMANADEFISKFSNGYDTHVGERGVRLSGGQKQRIAIARALLMDPRVLLLDEATSALDAESEYLVQDAMDRLMVGRTTLVIAHRLSTVKSADVVAVVVEGVIQERGSHETLLTKGGVYAALVRRQLQGGGANPSNNRR